MIEELDVVRLTGDLSRSGLKAGAEGTVVGVYDPAAPVVLVEFPDTEEVVIEVPVAMLEVIWKCKPARAPT